MDNRLPFIVGLLVLLARLKGPIRLRFDFPRAAPGGLLTHPLRGAEESLTSSRGFVVFPGGPGIPLIRADPVVG